MGAANRGLWKNLGVSKDRTWFTHPSDDNQKIYFFAEVPHLMKLLRNWLLDYGFTLGNGTILHKGPLVNLINLDSGEFKACHKLNRRHVSCEKAQRQNVAMACQLYRTRLHVLCVGTCQGRIPACVKILPIS